MTRDLSTAYTPSTMPLSTACASASRRRNSPVSCTRLSRMVLDRARELAHFLRAAGGDRSREVAVAELFDRVAQRAERTGDLLAEDHAREHGERGQHDCGHDQPTHEAADRCIDLAGGQPRLEQRDRFTGRGEHRKAGRVQVEIVDARHRGATVGQARRMQPREVVDALVLDERPVVDQADRRADALAQDLRHAVVEQPRDVQTAPGRAADLRRRTEDCIAPHGRRREETLALLGRRRGDLVPRQRHACLCDQLAALEDGAGDDRVAVARAAQVQAEARRARIRHHPLQASGDRRRSWPASARLRRSGADLRAPSRRRAARARCPAGSRDRAASRSRRSRCRRPRAARSRR